jgi:hypothetical protein
MPNQPLLVHTVDFMTGAFPKILDQGVRASALEHGYVTHLE